MHRGKAEKNLRKITPLPQRRSERQRRACDVVEILASWGAASNARALADAWKWCEGYNGVLKTAATKAIQAVIDFPALRVENVGEFGGSMERA